MPTHAEKKTLPYTQQQLFDLVADVEKYPQFLPWCVECRITRHIDDQNFLADLVIGYKVFQERFTSKVHLEPNTSIRVEYMDGPLRYLSNEWDFIENEDGTTTIDFFVDFEFKNMVFQKVMGVFFNEIVRRMVGAFETRAGALYAPSRGQRNGGNATSGAKGRRATPIPRADDPRST